MTRAHLTPPCMVGLLGLVACTAAPGEVSPPPPPEATLRSTCSVPDGEVTLELPPGKRVYDVDATDDSVVVTVTGGALRSTGEGWAPLPFSVRRLASDAAGYITGQVISISGG
ncbi:MAG: hypothetical protein KC731_13230, partial [Myxococcales bacterium]|nr:hypothetical protein [Myxococcales bacterium]